MVQPGRRSPASLTVLPTASSGARPRLAPPAILTTGEQAVFNEMAAANPHLTPTDAPLLAGYVQALTKMHRLAKRPDVGPWEKAARVAMSLGTKLRLTPQATQDPQALGRRRKDAQPPSFYDMMQIQVDDDHGR